MTFSQSQLHAAEAFIRKNLEDKDSTIPREVWLVAAAMQEGTPQWQPIETAPEDGRTFHAWFPSSQVIGLGFFVEAGYGYPADFHFEVEGLSGRSPGEPTHWLPLPPPPSSDPKRTAE